jgi:hypothetical protein
MGSIAKIRRKSLITKYSPTSVSGEGFRMKQCGKARPPVDSDLRVCHEWPPEFGEALNHPE